MRNNKINNIINNISIINDIIHSIPIKESINNIPNLIWNIVSSFIRIHNLTTIYNKIKTLAYLYTVIPITCTIAVISRFVLSLKPLSPKS